MFDDFVKARGKVKIVVNHANGTREYRCWNNLVVALGKNFIAARMVDDSVVKMGFMAVGTDATVPAGSDQTLYAEVAGSRQSLSSATYSGAVVTYTASFGPGIGTGALQEAGIFSAASAGVMLARVTYPLVNKGSLDTMSVTWTVTIT